jgi:hypothetical protein
LTPLGIAKVFTDQVLPSGGISGTMLEVRGLTGRRVPTGIAMADMNFEKYSINIVVLGKSGAGKSSFCNYFFDMPERFSTGRGKPVTTWEQNFQSHEFEKQGFALKMFDSVGLEAATILSGPPISDVFSPNATCPMNPANGFTVFFLRDQREFRTIRRRRGKPDQGGVQAFGAAADHSHRQRRGRQRQGKYASGSHKAAVPGVDHPSGLLGDRAQAGRSNC